MTSHVSPDNTLPRVRQTPQRQNSDSGNPINGLAEAMASITSQQRPQMLSASFKPTTTNTLVFDGKNRKLQLFDDLLQMMLKMQTEMSKAMKIKHFHSHLPKETVQTFKKCKCQQQTNTRRRTHRFQTKVRQTTMISHSKTQMAWTHFRSQHEITVKFPWVTKWMCRMSFWDCCTKNDKQFFIGKITPTSQTVKKLS